MINLREGRPVYIAEAIRSPIGVYRGQFKGIRPEHLGAYVLQYVDTLHIDGLFIGNAVGTGGNIGRLMSLYAGIDEGIPAITIDMQCASGLGAISWAVANIKAGLGHTYIAGGIESSSLQPKRMYGLGDSREGMYMTAQFSPDSMSATAMLEGAERVAMLHDMDRSVLDRWALESHRRASYAQEQNFLAHIMAPIDDDIVAKMSGEQGMHFSNQKLEKQVFTNNLLKDEGVRPTMNERLLSRMKPLHDGGLITAGNSCLTHDGVAFVKVTGERSPFEIVHSTMWAGNPVLSPEGAWHASEKILRDLHLTMDDIDVIEWNEAFAVIDCLFERAYPHLVERYNAWGGALAYGHPFAASGAIITAHCMERLRRLEKEWGLVAIAGAGGTGMAMVIRYDGNSN